MPYYAGYWLDMWGLDVGGTGGLFTPPAPNPAAWAA